MCAGLALALALPACGSRSTADTGAEDETEAGSSEGGASSSSSSGDAGLSPDEQACLDYCVNLQGTECGVSDDRCYGFCLNRIGFADDEGCADEERELAACLGSADLSASCEPDACRDAAARRDVCRGWCALYGGSQNAGASQTDCHWGATNCYGYEFEVECAVNPAGPCSCRVDEVEIATCEPAAPLQQFDCGSDDVHVFTSCCQAAFEEVLFP